MPPITVAVVGLGFGRDFVPIYRSHPDVAEVVPVDPDDARRAEIADRFGLGPGHADLDAALADPAIDAVHILAPVHLHADLVERALDAGKHVASAVPMATTLDDLDRLIAAEDRSGRNYLMMETAVFGREYLHVADRHARGEFGALTLYRGFHIQNLDGYPSYWQGYPPMHYVTHALSPLLRLLDTQVRSVRALGAGRLAPQRTTGGFDNPFPTEVGLFTLRDSDVVADVTMSFFQTARAYLEGFSLYGEHLGVEWPPDESGDLTVHRMSPPRDGHRGNAVETAQVDPGDFADRLPPSLRAFTREHAVLLPGMPAPVTMGAGHGGSHPFLVHEFVSSIVERRRPLIDARRAAAWTAPGICAHRSAMEGGAEVLVPDYLAR